MAAVCAFLGAAAGLPAGTACPLSRLFWRRYFLEYSSFVGRPFFSAQNIMGRPLGSPGTLRAQTSSWNLRQCILLCFPRQWVHRCCFCK